MFFPPLAVYLKEGGGSKAGSAASADLALDSNLQFFQIMLYKLKMWFQLLVFARVNCSFALSTPSAIRTHAHEDGHSQCSLFSVLFAGLCPFREGSVPGLL